MSATHIAQLNIGRFRYPTEDPRMAEFMGNLDRINALAERSAQYIGGGRSRGERGDPAVHAVPTAHISFVAMAASPFRSLVRVAGLGLGT